MKPFPLLEAGLVVVAVASQKVVYGMVRMFSLIEEHRHPNVHVVRTVAEAYRLLGVDAPLFSPTAVT
jgi:hypothetical protein